MTPLDELPPIGVPAVRALALAGYARLDQLAGVPRASLAALHGVGPKAVPPGRRSPPSSEAASPAA